MNPEEAVEVLCSAGLVARYTPNKTFGEITAYGDPYDSDHAIQCYRWVCWIDQQAPTWRVAVPPHLVPGPGPEFTVPTLQAAVSLAQFAFGRRIKAGGVDLREQFEHAHRIFDAWGREETK
jgi:hypothetical protein